MPRFLVERFIPRADELTSPELKCIVQQNLRVQQDLPARIRWVSSTLAADRMVCLYIADDEAVIREHARRSGLPIQRISEVTAIIGPTMVAVD